MKQKAMLNSAPWNESIHFSQTMHFLILKMDLACLKSSEGNLLLLVLLILLISRIRPPNELIHEPCNFSAMPNTIAPICWKSVNSYSVYAETHFPLELNEHAPAWGLCTAIVCHTDLYCVVWQKLVILSLESISILIIFHGVVLLEICTNSFVKEHLLEHTNRWVFPFPLNHILSSHLDSQWPQGNLTAKIWKKIQHPTN